MSELGGDYDSYDYQNVDTPTEAYGAEYDAYDFQDFGDAGTSDQIMESLGIAGIDLGNWNWGGAAPAVAEAGKTGAGSTPGVIGDKGSSATSDFGKFLSGAGDFVTKYKGPLEVVARGVQQAAKNRSDEKAAQIKSDQRMNEINRADQLKQDQSARISASVSGLRKPGLISQPRLQRAGGGQVFNQRGLINS